MRLVRVLTGLAITISMSLESAAAPVAGPTETVYGEWSGAVRGVRGRLVATAEPAYEGKPEVGLAVELENVSDSATPIAIWWSDLGDMLALEAQDGTHKPLAPSAVAGNHLTLPPFWLALPYQTAIRAWISKGALEYVPDGRVCLRPLTFVAWDLPAHGAVYVGAKWSPRSPKDDKRKSWMGTLELPRVKLPLAKH